MDYSRYPDNWKEFSKFIRFERANNRCEVEGCTAVNYEPHPLTDSKVMLTVAHLDGIGDVCQCEEETGQKCANPDHVLAMCQRCHLRYDIERHKFNRRRSRAAARGQLWLGDMEHRYERNL